MSKFDNIIKGTSVLYTRYMDGIICECNAWDVDGKLSEANQLHPSLNFTIGRETNCENSF